MFLNLQSFRVHFVIFYTLPGALYNLLRSSRVYFLIFYTRFECSLPELDFYKNVVSFEGTTRDQIFNFPNE